MSASFLAAADARASDMHDAQDEDEDDEEEESRREKHEVPHESWTCFELYHWLEDNGTDFRFECYGFESSTHSHAELLQRAQQKRASIERLQAEYAKRQARREPGPGPAVVIAYGQVGQQASLLDATHAQEELARRERLEDRN